MGPSRVVWAPVKLWAPRRKWTRQDEPGAKLRVLIVNLYPSLGDTVWVMPMVEVLKEANPEAEVTWMADSRMAALAAAHPDVDRVIRVHVGQHFFERLPIIRSYYRLYTLIREIRSLELLNRFDIAVVPHGRVDSDFSAHAVWMLNLPRSIGYSYKLEPNYLHNYGDALLTEVVHRPPCCMRRRVLFICSKHRVWFWMRASVGT